MVIVNVSSVSSPYTGTSIPPAVFDNKSVYCERTTKPGLTPNVLFQLACNSV